VACTETSAQPKGVGRGRRRSTGPSAAAARARRALLRRKRRKLGKEQQGLLGLELELPASDAILGWASSCLVVYCYCYAVPSESVDGSCYLGRVLNAGLER
jgi:hypothetical protein